MTGPTPSERAERQARTRRRIVRSRRGAARQRRRRSRRLSQVAERAAFSGTRSIALSRRVEPFSGLPGLVEERDPLPDAAAWRSIEDWHERLRVGLFAIYGWFERNADLAACVLRDAEYHPLTKTSPRCGSDRIGGLPGGARCRAEHEAARGAEAGSQLLTWRDTGARRWPRTGGCCQGLDQRYECADGSKP